MMQHRVVAIGFALGALVGILVVAQGLRATMPAFTHHASRITHHVSPSIAYGLSSPDWEPDHRASQDASGAGQHECAIAANPNNPDNAIAVSKDFRSGLAHNRS